MGMGLCNCDNNIIPVENKLIQNEMPSFDKITNKVCKIKCTNGKKGVGFFYKIPIKKNENNFIQVLINDSQTLNEKDFDSNKNNEIKITLHNGEEILIDESRKIYTNKEFEVTITEIKEDEIKDNNIFSEIDKINPNISDKPEKFLIYNLDYNNNNDKMFNFSFCYLKDINKKNNNIIEYENEDKDKEFPLGSLLFNLKGNIIGIHKQKDKEKNFGILIKGLINEYINNFEELFETNINNDS
jgi:hypothetical protein